MYLEYTWFWGLAWISVTQETSFKLLVNTGKYFFFMRGDSFFDQLIKCSEGRLLLICYLLSVYLKFLFVIH